MEIKHIEPWKILLPLKGVNYIFIDDSETHIYHEKQTLQIISSCS